MNSALEHGDANEQENRCVPWLVLENELYKLNHYGPMGVCPLCPDCPPPGSHGKNIYKKCMPFCDHNA